MEAIRQVDGFPGYFISRDGRVLSQWKLRGPLGPVLCDPENMRKLKPHPASKVGNKIKYATVHLFKEKKSFTFAVHCLVAEAFHGKCPDGLECAHKNGDYTDNHADNLEWKTRAQNCQDKIKHGTSLAGEKHNLAKLTSVQVLEIYNRYDSGESSVEIAKDFNVHARHVRVIGRKKNWTHLLGSLPVTRRPRSQPYKKKD